MTAPTRNHWRAIHDEILHRIRSRVWPPGQLIPKEEDLATEFGCARATINRALREAADAGLLERKRRAGTRVALQPAHKAVYRIPLVRDEIEDLGKKYSYELLLRRRRRPPKAIHTAMKLNGDASTLELRSLHLGDGRPFAYEDRWINLATVPEAEKTDFRSTSANEWLLAHASFTRGLVGFSAEEASEQVAALLQVEVGSALFTTKRTTWWNDACITRVKLVYAPGYRIEVQI